VTSLGPTDLVAKLPRIVSPHPVPSEDQQEFDPVASALNQLERRPGKRRSSIDWSTGGGKLHAKKIEESLQKSPETKSRLLEIPEESTTDYPPCDEGPVVPEMDEIENPYD